VIPQVKEIALGLEYLHSVNVVHGDCKGANILVDAGWHARVADFGLSIFAEVTKTFHPSTARHGSSRWMAPELINPAGFNLPKAKKTPATDVFAFACLCVELYTGDVPFSSIEDGIQVMYQIAQGQRPIQPTDMPDELWKVVVRCWAHVPSERPTMFQVVEILDTIPSFKCPSRLLSFSFP